MSYEVLARKWRPQVFEDVIGQEHITQTLINAIKTERLAHAYLFSGARGVGKTSVARILAKAMNCTDGKPGIPCNKCRSCTEITGGSSVDVQEIDGASNRGIDEIRELRDNIKYMPSSSQFRIYIIDEVHMLTLPAFNALLKTLEEPPAHVKFFFATTEPHKVPVTILSRCQRFDFKRIPLGKILQHLKKIAKKEGIKISESGLTIMAREAEGSMRDAESLLDQVVSYAGAKVEEKDVLDILGIIDRDLIFESSRAIIEGAPERCMEIVERIYNYGYDLKEFYRALMDQFRNLLVSLIAPQTQLLDMTESDREEIIRQAQVAGAEKLRQSLNLLIAREEDLRFTSHARLVLETIMIKLCRLGQTPSFEEIIEKIEALEKRLSTTPFEGQVPSGQHSLPVTDREMEPETSEGSDGLPEKADNRDWEGFLDFLSAKNGAMANVLREWHLHSMTDKTLEIRGGFNSFSSSYLEEPERLKKLTDYCRGFFKKKLKIKIIKDSGRVGTKEKPVKREEFSFQKKRYADLPQPVQEIIQIFKGKIIGEVNSKDKRKEDSGKAETTRRSK